MSYDFSLFRLKAPVRSHQDLTDQTVGDIEDVEHAMHTLASLYPNASWEPDIGGWRLVLDGPDTFYEIRLHTDLPGVPVSLSIGTSHGAATRSEVDRIAVALGLVAMDMQTCELSGCTAPPA